MQEVKRPLKHRISHYGYVALTSKMPYLRGSMECENTRVNLMAIVQPWIERKFTYGVCLL